MLRSRLAPFVCIALLLAACSSNPSTDDASTENGSADRTTLRPSAAAGTADIERPEGDVVPISSTGADELRDLLRPGDPAAAYCLADLGVGPGEFYRKDIDELVFPEQTFFFEARYDDGSVVEIRIHPDVVVDSNAPAQAERIAEPISLLPTELRRDIQRLGLLFGESTAQADGGGEGIHVYADNVAVREAANRFEETIFHESVHTSLDDTYAADPEWRAAQVADDGYLTEYAADYPDTEDLAETALYAWALIHHPERISEADETAWRSLVPARISFIDDVLSAPGEGYVPAEPSC